MDQLCLLGLKFFRIRVFDSYFKGFVLLSYINFNRKYEILVKILIDSQFI